MKLLVCQGDITYQAIFRLKNIAKWHFEKKKKGSEKATVPRRSLYSVSIFLSWHWGRWSHKHMMVKGSSDIISVPFICCELHTIKRHHSAMNCSAGYSRIRSKLRTRRGFADDADGSIWGSRHLVKLCPRVLCLVVNLVNTFTIFTVHHNRASMNYLVPHNRYCLTDNTARNRLKGNHAWDLWPCIVEIELWANGSICSIIETRRL